MHKTPSEPQGGLVWARSLQFQGIPDLPFPVSRSQRAWPRALLGTQGAEGTDPSRAAPATRL